VGSGHDPGSDPGDAELVHPGGRRNGGTDYDEAFAAATAHNGSADARIFLTDGLASGRRRT
jgi:hypothetical protein